MCWQFILITVGLMKATEFQARSIEILGNDLERYNESLYVEKRLPNEVVPLAYTIAISPDFLKDEFHGSVRIDIEILKARCNIVLHAKDLTIASTKLYLHKSRVEIPIEFIFPVRKYEMIVIKPKRMISSGKYILRMNFKGNLKGKINGFYLSTYANFNEPVRKLAVTQFEPFYARNAFPCFDEPSFKSVFLIRIVHSEGPHYHALSNMPISKVEKVRNNGDKTVTFFDPTPPMSPYLVAFIVSDFECLASSMNRLNGSKVPLNICVRSVYKTKAKFALNVGVRLMEYYSRTFKIDYPLPKLDLVAIPDFAAGAMENWGLVTFRETEVLHSEDHSSCENTKRVSLTVAHELAHMWFGNLVTMKWWNDLWLNEGFATYMEHVAVDFIFPEWNQMEHFSLYTKYVSMKHDGKSSSRPIISHVENPEEIDGMFDRISYQKVLVI